MAHERLLALCRAPQRREMSAQVRTGMHMRSEPISRLGTQDFLVQVIFFLVFYARVEFISQALARVRASQVCCKHVFVVNTCMS